MWLQYRRTTLIFPLRGLYPVMQVRRCHRYAHAVQNVEQLFNNSDEPHFLNSATSSHRKKKIPQHQWGKKKKASHRGPGGWFKFVLWVPWSWDSQLLSAPEMRWACRPGCKLQAIAFGFGRVTPAWSLLLLHFHFWTIFFHLSDDNSHMVSCFY